MVKRYEDVNVYTLGFATSEYGETVTTKTLKFNSKAEVKEVKKDQ